MRRVLVMAGIWVATSLLQVPVWRDNVTLLRHTARLNPDLARPALNLGVAYRQAGDRGAAVIWLGEAWRLSATSPRTREIRAVARQELLWLEAFGYPACAHPPAQPACSSF